MTEHLTRRRIDRGLEREALELWADKPESERFRKVGLFRREEDVSARERFVRDYVDQHYEKKVAPGARNRFMTAGDYLL